MGNIYDCNIKYVLLIIMCFTDLLVYTVLKIETFNDLVQDFGNIFNEEIR